MEILTKLDRVFDSTDSCLGCGSILGFKFALQTIENLKNTVIIISSGEISDIIRSHVRANIIVSPDPSATASGLSKARPDLNIIVYASNGTTTSTISSILSNKDNILYICYNNSLRLNPYSIKEFVPAVRNATYCATVSVAYYEDFVAKLRKSFPRTGFKFIDLLAPCPARWNFDTSNTIEIGRMITESFVWPLYEIDNGNVSVTKIPSNTDTVKRVFEILKTAAPDDKIREIQDRVNKRWKALNEGRMI